MKTECPHCGQHYETDDSAIGQIAKCTSCGQEFVLEQRETSELDEFAQEQQNQQATIPAAPANTYSSSIGLKALACEMCGSTDMIKQDGIFVCQSCGTKYSMEEAKKMMIAGTVNVAGTVKVDMSERLQNLYTIARRAKDEDNYENAAKYYELILQEDPQSWEASFYFVYYDAMTCHMNEIVSAATSINNCLKNVVHLVLVQESVSKRIEIFTELNGRVIFILDKFGRAATNHFEKSSKQDESQQKFINEITVSAQICYSWGDILENIPHITVNPNFAWKAAINLHRMCICYCEYQEPHKYHLQKYANKIKKTEPYYVLPRIPSAASGCYIATAIYGTYDCPEVWTLRRFRDNTMAQTLAGRIFIHIYYATSPALVKYFGHIQWFRTFGRKLLDSFVKTLKERGVESTPYSDKIWH